MSVHLAFIDLGEADQAKELRDYLRGKGAEISEGCSDDFIADLKELISNCAVTWKSNETTETEIEAVMNSLISLIILVPEGEELVNKFCQEVGNTDGSSNQWNQVRLRVLSNLFNGFNEGSASRLPVYSSMVRFAGHSNLLHLVPTEFKQVKHFIEIWNLPKNKTQDLLRVLHEAYSQVGQRDNASRAMLELLGTYTESTAAQAKDDAQKCIVTTLGDPNTFLMDHLLALKPVKMLEGEKIHELLMIFVSGKLQDYENFAAKNMDYVKGLGLDHEQNVKKMRLLTFMMIADSQSSVDFKTVVSEMGVKESDVEQFVIDAVKTRTVMAKMDQMNQKILINSSTSRTFDKQNWVELNRQLESWKSRLEKMSQGFQLILAQAGGQP